MTEAYFNDTGLQYKSCVQDLVIFTKLWSSQQTGYSPCCPVGLDSRKKWQPRGRYIHSEKIRAVTIFIRFKEEVIDPRPLYTFTTDKGNHDFKPFKEDMIVPRSLCTFTTLKGNHNFRLIEQIKNQLLNISNYTFRKLLQFVDSNCVWTTANVYWVPG